MENSIIPLEAKDVKKLKRRRLFYNIFTGYMCVVTIAMFVFAGWLYYEESDHLPAGILAIGAVIACIVPIIMWNNSKKITEDLRKGIKEISKGVIEKKYSYKNRHELTVNGKTFQTNYKNYQSVNKGDLVLVAFAPQAKMILDLSEIEDTDDQEV